MAKTHATHGGNGRGLPAVTREQLEAFKNMVLLPKHERREVLDMVIMYELVEDRPEEGAIRREVEAH